MHPVLQSLDPGYDSGIRVRVLGHDYCLLCPQRPHRPLGDREEVLSQLANENTEENVFRISESGKGIPKSLNDPASPKPVSFPASPVS